MTRIDHAWLVVGTLPDGDLRYLTNDGFFVAHIHEARRFQSASSADHEARICRSHRRELMSVEAVTYVVRTEVTFERVS